MSYEIAKGQTKFQMGISNPLQLNQWLQENPKLIGVLFTGRSNVGKSSLINSLFGQGTARTSRTPGRTREINVFTFSLNHDGLPDTTLPTFYLFDLPGYGHAEISKQMAENWNKLMNTFFANLPRHIVVLNIHDARHPNQKSDQDFVDFLKPYGLQTILAFNKMDKLKTQKERAQLTKLRPELLKQFKWVKTIHFVSAQAKTGLIELEQSFIGSMLNKKDNLLHEMP